MTDRLPHGPRSDARDNRGLIVDAARATFLAVGLDVPIREVARRAQVAPATVYRHFPTKEVLAAKVFRGRHSTANSPRRSSPRTRGRWTSPRCGPAR